VEGKKSDQGTREKRLEAALQEKGGIMQRGRYGIRQQHSFKGRDTARTVAKKTGNKEGGEK